MSLCQILIAFRVPHISIQLLDRCAVGDSCVSAFGIPARIKDICKLLGGFSLRQRFILIVIEDIVIGAVGCNLVLLDHAR